MCSLASKLTVLRENLGLTKKQVAEAVGVHPSSIGNLEKGSIPQADLLFALAKLFNVSMEYLLDSNIIQVERTQFPHNDIDELDDDDKAVLYLYHQLNDAEKEDIKELMEFKVFRKQKDEMLSTSDRGEKGHSIA